MTSWLAVLVAWLGTFAGPADADPACLLLGGLDARRAVAFVLDEPDLLEGVYADDDLRAQDAEVLGGYRSRGLRLRGMVQERTGCEVRERDDDRVVLDVVDRLGPTRVEAEGVVGRLPRDEPSRRTVTIVSTPTGWTERAWRVASSR